MPEPTNDCRIAHARSTDDDNRPVVLVNHLVEDSGKLTGITRYAFGLLDAMIARGTYRYVLATCWDRKDLPPTIAEGAEDIVTLPHVRSTPLSFFNQFRVLRKISRQYNASFVYSMNPMCPAIPGVPTLVTVHDLYYDAMPELYARRHLLWWRSYFALPARFAATIACVSQNTANDLARFHPRHAARTHLVPGAGVLPLHSQSESQDDLGSGISGAPYFLILGNVTPNKNVPFFIEALASLRSQGRPLRAIHVGRDLSGDLARALQGIPDGLIETRGGLDDAALNNLMKNALALVQPSLYEGFGLPIIEAHERSVPVIASDIAIFREVAGDGAVFVRLGDVQGLAAAMQAIATDGSHRARMAARASANALRFSWNASAQAAEEAIGRSFALSPASRRHPQLLVRPAN